MFIICGWDINSEQDISLFVNTYFRFGIVLRNIHDEKSTNCAYIVPIRQNEESGVCYKMKAVYIYIYIYMVEKLPGLAPIMYVMGIKILSYLDTRRRNRSWWCSGFVTISQAREQLTDSGHVSRFSFLPYTFGELQSRVKFHFETVFLRDIFMHITYVNV